MKKIKILALTKSTGGIAFYNKMLLSALDHERFESHTICLSEGAESYAGELDSVGLSSEVLAMARYKVDLLGDLRVLRHVIKIARAREADVLICHGSKAGFIGRAAGRILRRPAIYRQASMPFLKRVQGRRAPVYWALEVLGGWFGGKMVAITEYARKETQRNRVVSPDDIQVIRTGVDTERFRPAGRRDVVAKKLGLDPERPIVGWFGRLEPQKAPLDYVATLRQVAPAHPKAQFVIAGEGRLHEEIENALRGLENVHLLPWQNDLENTFQAVDIYTLSSHWEGLPLTLLQAMASGCVPVSTTVDGCAEAIETGVSGLLVAPGAPDEMAAALDTLLSSPESMPAMALAARQRVLDLFDRRRMVREWEDFLTRQVALKSKLHARPPNTAALPALDMADGQTGLRICMVISSYHPIVGGAEKQVAQLARLMIARGHAVRVITRRYPGLPAFELIDDIEVQRIRASGPKVLAAARFLIGAARAIRRYAPDVVHCHSTFSPTLAGILSGGFSSRPLLAKPMCGGEVTSIMKKTGGRLRRYAMQHRVTRFVAVSSEIETELQQFGFPASKVLSIPNGVDTERFRPCSGSDEKAGLRKTLGLPEGTLFLFAGRFARQKQLPLLLEAWPWVRAQCPDATLLIAGANRDTASGFKAVGGEAESIPSHLLEQDGVRFLGHVDDMPSYLRACDAFVLPSLREGLSNALLEACASGLAVVASNVGGTEDLIEDGHNGRLFPPGNLDELARALTDLGRDPGLRQTFGELAVKTIRERFDIRQTAERLLLAYVTLSGPRTPTPEPALGKVARSDGGQE
ncbi:glycosyltransferase [Ruegeria atlantica]|uniref:GDP-mannose-dependent alpha-(1-2)-phosphatidylinositol mannosyltransferase n=1 Tax=Ruegeria atlantica TaxID=81569 RepID=A0A0P1E4Q7_9RHOB|nr:glycosyltransferase [Ruegeria atlantica]CUH42219.1 GDP-mannose-dependent alpha-(1-2)-phosphatidylinositol mannosyltransferase [Ruegeria atlantica]